MKDYKENGKRLISKLGLEEIAIIIKELQTIVNGLPEGEYELKNIYGYIWYKLIASEKRERGKIVKQLVLSGEIESIKYIGNNSARHVVYRVFHKKVIRAS